MADPLTTTAPAGGPSLRDRMTAGVLWLTLQSALTRVLGSVQTLALAWLLEPGDWGSVGLALTVSSFLSLLCDPGIESVLVNRGKRLRLWTTHAFWMGMTLGLAGLAGMLAVAPLAAWAYGAPEVRGLIAVLALTAPLNALLVVPNAILRADLRFRELATLTFLHRAISVSATIVAAALGYGAYSFVLPAPLASGVTAAFGWWWTKPRVRAGVRVSRWRSLVGSSAQVGVTRLLQTIVLQGAYIALGLLSFSKDAIGLYYFAFSISTQAFQLISASIMAALFPALAQLAHDPARQVGASLRAARMLAVTSIPFCMVQVVLAEPVFHLLFPPDKQPAVRAYQLLLLGFVVNAPAWPASSLLLAQGRFRETMLLWLRWSLGFCALVGAVAWTWHDITPVAGAVGLWYAACGVAVHRLAMSGAARRSVVRESLPALAAATAAALAAAAAVWWTPRTTPGDLAAIALGGTLFAGVYLALLARLGPRDFADTLDQVRLRRLAQRVRGTATGGDQPAPT